MTLPDFIASDVPLATYTTLRIGGKARYYCEPANERLTIKAVHWALDRSIPITTLGNGSNVVISDEGWNGLIINTRFLSDISWDSHTCHCQAGADLGSLVKQSVDRGLAGIVELAGIPGTIGGAVIMNAGAFGHCISEVLTHVTTLDLTDESLVEYHISELSFGYRTTTLRDMRKIILRVTCRFTSGDHGALLSTYLKTLSARKEKQPLDTRNCGSVFKNPTGAGAGRFIQQCGLKGYRIGDVEVSTKHANFVINRGNATAEDFKRVVEHVRKTVHDRCDVILEPEVIFLGAFK